MTPFTASKSQAERFSGLSRNAARLQNTEQSGISQPDDIAGQQATLFFQSRIGTSITVQEITVRFTRNGFNHVLGNHTLPDKKRRAKIARLMFETLENPCEIWKDEDGALVFLASYVVQPKPNLSAAFGPPKETPIQIIDVVKIYPGHSEPQFTTSYTLQDDNRVEKKRDGELVYAVWRDNSRE